MTAIRAADAALGTFTLTGHVLHSSCEPCPMCLGAAMWARIDRIDRIVDATDRHDAALAGFDDDTFYQFFAQPPTHEGRTDY